MVQGTENELVSELRGYIYVRMFKAEGYAQGGSICQIDRMDIGFLIEREIEELDMLL